LVSPLGRRPPGTTSSSLVPGRLGCHRPFTVPRRVCARWSSSGIRSGAKQAGVRCCPALP
jgi:hypothetical protein